MNNWKWEIFSHFPHLGGPILNLLVWMVLRLHLHDPETVTEDPTIDCPFFDKTMVDIYVFELPLFIILFFNTFFLIWIMVVSPLYKLPFIVSTTAVFYYLDKHWGNITHYYWIIARNEKENRNKKSSFANNFLWEYILLIVLVMRQLPMQLI